MIRNFTLFDDTEMETKEKSLLGQYELDIRGFLIQDSEEIPRLRESVDQMFYATQDGPFNIRQLAMTLEQDKDLQNTILEICSSEFYSGKTPIRQIGQAIRRLGPVGFRGVAMQAFLQLDVYYNPRWERATNTLKQYSIAVAHACRVTSASISSHEELSFLLGILHRIGQSAPLLVLPDPNEDSAKAAQVSKTLQSVHPSISQYILQKWGMPDALIETIGSYGQLIINNKPNQLGAILIIAEEIVKRIGRKEPVIFATKEYCPPFPKDSFQDACRILNIPEQEIPTLIATTQEALRSSSQ